MFVYDTMGEYDDSGIVFTDYESLENFWLDHTENFRIVYQPLQPKDEFPYIAHLVYNVGDCVFVVEELDNFCSPYELPFDMANIIQRGRHANIDFIGVSQRPFGINRTVSAQCKEIITFQQSEPRDIQYLSTYIGKEVERVRDLGKYHYLHWCDGHVAIHSPTGEIRTPYKDTDDETEEYEEVSQATDETEHEEI